jgi:hypothetical protein
MPGRESRKGAVVRSQSAFAVNAVKCTYLAVNWEEVYSQGFTEATAPYRAKDDTVEQEGGHFRLNNDSRAKIE